MSSDAAPLSGPDLRAAGIAAADLADGAMVLGHAGGEPVVLARRGDEAFAVGAACTHYSGPLAEGLLVGETIRCPLHHACFSLRTGAALRAPALNPIPCWDVERRDGRWYVMAKRGERDPLAPVPGGSAPRGTPPASVVIIGAGAAGSAAAEMLRREGYSGPVTIIDGEPDSPYDRPNLSKDYLAGAAQEEWMPLRLPDFYREHTIEIVRGRAASIDVARSEVLLEGNRRVRYGALLLATGAEPVRLPISGNDRSFVFTLRSWADSRAIIAAAPAAQRAVVIGASFIGLEVAGSLRQRNIDVHVVAPESAPLDRILGAQLGARIRALHEQHGVVFHLSTKPAKIDDGSVILENGESLAADLVVIGVGVRPQLDLATQAGLAIDRGVTVNEYLESSVPRIFAAGDIARWPDPHTGARIRVEHWVLAQRQGQTAARNILGANEQFDAVPFFWSQHYDIAVRYTGHAEQWDQIDVAGTLATDSASVAYRAQGRTLAVASLGADHANLEAEAALERNDEPALRRIVGGAASG
jgi:NADPH-dependent 2,4-dienoyl-CoA reductase/sulfur reductase-like enzyme/nitrite reductase/ring-hydroxylating ferredoxin subunit